MFSVGNKSIVTAVLYCRRPLATRDKLIHSMTVKQTDEHHFEIGLSTQAGTYPFVFTGQP